MGNQKLKWTAEEEEALVAGISKHGAGKWKNILRDPEFFNLLFNLLFNRSNIDLKDKWRNMNVPPFAQAITKEKEDPTLLEEDDKLVVDTKIRPRCDGMIFEAISALADANGSDVGSIFSFIEPRHEVPSNFRRVLSSRLRRLAAQGKLEKLQNFYKIADYSGATRRCAPKPKETNVKPRQANNQEAPTVSQEMIDEAATTAAYKLVEAENKIDVAKTATEELEKMNKLAEKSELLLEIAKEMDEQCSGCEVVQLA
ncbi:unnamed protein product [Cochlearia groenlandica]